MGFETQTCQHKTSTQCRYNAGTPTPSTMLAQYFAYIQYIEMINARHHNWWKFDFNIILIIWYETPSLHNHAQWFCDKTLSVLLHTVYFLFYLIWFI